MTDQPNPSLAESRSWIPSILFCTLIVGVLDIGEVILFYALRGVAPLRILQSVATGVLGKASFQGGAATAALGLALHFVIAFLVVVAYLLISRRVPSLHRRPILSGAAYGLFVYAFMNFVVLPLSAAGRSHAAGLALANTLFAHVVCVGIPTALYWSAHALRAQRK